MPRADSQSCRIRKERALIQQEQRRLYEKIRCQTAEYRRKERERYHASTIPNGRQPHVYILKYEGDLSGCFKVGRTGDYSKRVKDLNCGHLMRVKYVAQYPNFGHLELLAHDELAPLSSEGLQSRMVRGECGAYGSDPNSLLLNILKTGHWKERKIGKRANIKRIILICLQFRAAKKYPVRFLGGYL